MAFGKNIPTSVPLTFTVHDWLHTKGLTEMVNVMNITNDVDQNHVNKNNNNTSIYNETVFNKCNVSIDEYEHLVANMDAIDSTHTDMDVQQLGYRDLANLGDVLARVYAVEYCMDRLSTHTTLSDIVEMYTEKSKTYFPELAVPFVGKTVDLVEFLSGFSVCQLVTIGW